MQQSFLHKWKTHAATFWQNLTKVSILSHYILMSEFYSCFESNTINLTLWCWLKRPVEPHGTDFFIKPTFTKMNIWQNLATFCFFHSLWVIEDFFVSCHKSTTLRLPSVHLVVSMMLSEPIYEIFLKHEFPSMTFGIPIVRNLELFWPYAIVGEQWDSSLSLSASWPLLNRIYIKWIWQHNKLNKWLK